jgi:hypothetical protein
MFSWFNAIVKLTLDFAVRPFLYPEENPTNFQIPLISGSRLSMNPEPVNGYSASSQIAAKRNALGASPAGDH